MLKKLEAELNGNRRVNHTDKKGKKEYFKLDAE